jgi:hypothetical protein
LTLKRGNVHVSVSQCAGSLGLLRTHLETKTLRCIVRFCVQKCTSSYRAQYDGYPFIAAPQISRSAAQGETPKIPPHVYAEGIYKNVASSSYTLLWRAWSREKRRASSSDRNRNSEKSQFHSTLLCVHRNSRNSETPVPSYIIIVFPARTKKRNHHHAVCVCVCVCACVCLI